jgi:proton glutamate symport protein
MADAPARKTLSLTKQIFIGLGLGILAGFLVNRYHPEWATVFKPFSKLFLLMIKMIIAPLIFTSLVAGIAGGDRKGMGWMAVRAMAYFIAATGMALIIGLVTVSWTRPGVGVQLPPPTAAPEITAKPQTWDQILLGIMPESIIKAMAEGNVLQIVVFSIIFAMGLRMLKERGRPVVQLCELVSETMFKVTGILMHYAPIGVGAAIAYTVGHGGVKVLWNLAQLVGTLYLALAVFVLVVLLPVALFNKIPIRAFLKMVREPAMIAFTTTASEAAMPSAMERLEKFGVPRRIVSFILPLGYSFNLDGSTLYLSLASIFVAQAAGVQLTVGQQVTMMLTLMLTSKGIAAVPRASLIILAGTLANYGLPLEALALILGVDELMDMARTMVNLVGNCLATVLVAKWQGELREPAGMPEDLPAGTVVASDPGASPG